MKRMSRSLWVALVPAVMAGVLAMDRLAAVDQAPAPVMPLKFNGVLQLEVFSTVRTLRVDITVEAAGKPVPGGIMTLGGYTMQNSPDDPSRYVALIPGFEPRSGVELKLKFIEPQPRGVLHIGTITMPAMMRFLGNGLNYDNHVRLTDFLKGHDWLISWEGGTPRFDFDIYQLEPRNLVFSKKNIGVRHVAVPWDIFRRGKTYDLTVRETGIPFVFHPASAPYGEVNFYSYMYTHISFD